MKTLPTPPKQLSALINLEFFLGLISKYFKNKNFNLVEFDVAIDIVILKILKCLIERNKDDGAIIFHNLSVTQETYYF